MIDDRDPVTEPNCRHDLGYCDVVKELGVIENSRKNTRGQLLFLLAEIILIRNDSIVLLDCEFLMDDDTLNRDSLLVKFSFIPY